MGAAPEPEAETIPELLGRLVDDGRAWAGAEARLAGTIARYRAGRARTGLVALGAAAGLGLAALVGATVGLVLGLAGMIGPWLAGIVITALLGTLAWLVSRFAFERLQVLKGNEEEAAALRRGRNRR